MTPSRTLAQPPLLQRGIRRSIRVHVAAQVGELTRDLVEVGDRPRYRPVTAFSLVDEEVEQQQAGEDAVALGEVVGEGVTADSSPPIIAPVSIIFGPTYLKPTGVSWIGTS